MKSGLAAAIACTAALAIAGCGSSSSGDSSTAGSTGTSASAGSTSTSAIASSPGETVKGDTTPKFASPSPSAPVLSGLVQIAYRDIAIEPDTVRVKVGTRIRWTNYDSTQANVTSEGGPQKFASGNFGKGGTFEITASRPGVIRYESTLYPVTMNGTIEVLS